MAASDRLSDNRSGAAPLYLLFAGRHGQPTSSTGSLVAAFASHDEARAAFRQARLRLSDVEGWAELTMVADGAKAKTVSWFGHDRRRSDQSHNWLLSADHQDVAAPHGPAARHRRRPARRLLRRG